VTELAEPLEMSLPAVSKHLRVLERAGRREIVLTRIFDAPRERDDLTITAAREQ
jgi:predicted transcriptional regulator